MKYWAYINNEILGPYEKEKLLQMPVFTPSTLLCPQTPVGEKTEEWKEASTYPEIASLLKAGGSQDPGSQNGNAAVSGPAEQSANQAQNASYSTQPAESGQELSKSGRKLSTLTPHTIDPTPPPAQEINPAIEVNHLDAVKGEPKQEEPSYSSPSFEPLTISQVGKRPMPFSSDNAKPASFTEGQTPEILIPQPSQQPAPAAIPPLEPFTPAVQEPLQSAAVPALSSETEGQKDSGSVNTKPEATARIEEISSRFEAMARNAATKEDIEQLKVKLGQMGELLASMKSAQIHQEIMENIQRLAHSVADLKELIAQKPAAAVQPVHIEQNSDIFSAAPAGADSALRSVEPRQPKKGTETLIVDHGSMGKSSKLAVFLKKTLGFLFFLITLAAILSGGIFALKYFGGPDLTRFLPFGTAISGEQQTALPAPTPFQQKDENTEATPEPGPAQTAAKKQDISPEIVYFARTYSLKQGGSTLENKIHEDAVLKKGNFNNTSWQARELQDGMFELTASVPMLGTTGQLSYRYEVDYAKKTIKPLDAMAQKPLDALINQKPPRAAPPIGRKTASPKTKPGAKRAVVQAAAKPAAPADEEYEYVYEDEAGTAE